MGSDGDTLAAIAEDIACDLIWIAWEIRGLSIWATKVLPACLLGGFREW